MEAPHDPHLGRMIRGYCLESLIGRGTVTTLYKGRTEELWVPPELVFILLSLPEHFSENAEKRFRERFMRRARRIIHLRHGSLFPLFGYGEQDGDPYLLMPDIPEAGVTLSRLLKEKQFLNPVEAFTILAPLSSAFDYMHKHGLVYQFFSPANILLNEDVPPQITGLGLSQISLLAGLEETLTASTAHPHLKNVAGSYLGSPEYLAPEVIRGGRANKQSDVYSLGIILFEMLSGAPPFSGNSYVATARMHIRQQLPSLHELNNEIPVSMELVVNRALHRNPEYRYASAGEFIAAFSHVLDKRLQVPGYNPHGDEQRALPAPTARKTLRLPAPGNGHQDGDEADESALSDEDAQFERTTSTRIRDQERPTRNKLQRRHVSGTLAEPTYKQPDDEDLTPETEASPFEEQTSRPRIRPAALPPPAAAQNTSREVIPATNALPPTRNQSPHVDMARMAEHIQQLRERLQSPSRNKDKGQ